MPLGCPVQIPTFPTDFGEAKVKKLNVSNCLNTLARLFFGGVVVWEVGKNLHEQ